MLPYSLAQPYDSTTSTHHTLLFANKKKSSIASRHNGQRITWFTQWICTNGHEAEKKVIGVCECMSWGAKRTKFQPSFVPADHTVARRCIPARACTQADIVVVIVISFLCVYPACQRICACFFCWWGESKGGECVGCEWYGRGILKQMRRWWGGDGGGAGGGEGGKGRKMITFFERLFEKSKIRN